MPQHRITQRYVLSVVVGHDQNVSARRQFAEHDLGHQRDMVHVHGGDRVAEHIEPVGGELFRTRIDQVQLEIVPGEDARKFQPDMAYAEDRDGATMTAHGVVFGSGWWWFDSYGFTPTVPGTAEWRDGQLVLDRSSERGRTVTVLRIRDGQLGHDIDTAVPADGPLLPLLRASYARKDAQAG